MRDKYMRCIGIIFILLLQGCASNISTSAINDSAKKFSEVVANSAATIESNAKLAPSWRRDEAIMAYLNGHTESDNITKSAPLRSFANYVCAGSASLNKQLAFFDYAKAYATALQGITAPGANTFSAQWAEFKKNQRPLPDLPANTQPRTPSQTIFAKCVADLSEPHSPLLSFDGIVATNVSDEVAFLAIPAAVLALKSLITSLQTAGTDVLGPVNQIQARHRAAELIKAQHAKFSQSLTTDLSTQTLDDAWIRRKRDALWRPYFTFRELLDFEPRTQAYQIVKLSAQLQTELAAYDAISAAKSPSEVISALAAAEAVLYKAATDDSVSLDGTFEFLSGIADDLSKVAADYKDIQTKTAAANAAIR